MDSNHGEEGQFDQAKLDEDTYLRLCMIKLVQVSDRNWTRYLFQTKFAKSRNHQFQNEDSLLHIQSLHQKAEQAAREHWHLLTQQYDILNPIARMKSYGVSVRTEMAGPLDEVFIHFALFDPVRKVVEVLESAVCEVERCIEKTGIRDLLGQVSVMDLILWHEYYHVWMWQQNLREIPGIKSWLGVPFLRTRSTTVQDEMIEELSAILFSKMACCTAYHPQVLQWLLVYTKDPKRAFKMLNDIAEESE